MNQPTVNIPVTDPLRPQNEGETRMARMIRISAFVLVIAGGAAFGAILYSATQGDKNNSGNVPLIAADSDFREKPSEPGGMTIANQDSTVYNMLSGNTDQPGMERLLPPPEAPIDAPQAVVGDVNPPIPGTMPEPVRPDGKPALTAEEIRLIHQDRRQAMADTGDAASKAVNELQTAAQEPVGGLTSPTPSATIQFAEGTQLPAPAEPMVTPIEPEVAAAEAAAPELEKVAPAAGKAAPAAGANRFIQLGALKSKAAAESSWKKLQQAHPDQLGALTSSVKEAKVAGKGTLYRLRGGPVTESEAKSICDALKATKTDCIVTK